MKKPKRDPVREDRIHNEAIADANGPEEQVMGWHCYLDDKIRFPFHAKCIAVKVVSPLQKGETVEVLRMVPELSPGGRQQWRAAPVDISPAVQTQSQPFA